MGNCRTKKLGRLITGLALVWATSLTWVGACTTAVISGSATADGRPILWKNRDADDLHNELVYCGEGRYGFVGVVNHGDNAGLEIWAGVNEKGFAVMNSASYNLGEKEDTRAEGLFMRLALQSCADVDEFQALLEKTNRGIRDVAANFGVIDAKGGAAYFETGDGAFKRMDAENPREAPKGFLVRSNYSHSGTPGKGSGFIREERALDLIGRLVDAKRLTPRTLLESVSRDVANTQIGCDPAANWKPGGPLFAYVGDSISRQDTSSAFVAAGVKPGEDPILTTAWVILGLPVTGVAVPVWAGAHAVPAETASTRRYAPLNELFAHFGRWLYPRQKGELRKYFNLTRWFDPQIGLQKSLLAIEAETFRQVDQQLEEWRTIRPSPETLAEFQSLQARAALEAGRKVFKDLVMKDEEKK